MPEEEIESSASEEKGWLGKIKDSIYQNWQTILVALIVLIVGISAYNYNMKTGTNSSEPKTQEENAAQEEEKTDETAEADNQEEYVEEKDQESVQENQTATNDTNANADQQTEETKTEETNTTNMVENSDDGYKVTAARGEGITHLARKALNQYLSENNDSELTAAHKVYIEDYLQNRIGSQGIEIGHEENISKKSIEEAIASAKKLSPNSLNNLKKYTVI